MLSLLETLDLFQILLNASFSIQRVVIGVILAFVVGVFFGLVRSSCSWNIKKNLLFRFILEAPKFPPPIAWIPFVILLLGIGEFPSYAIVFIGAFSPIFTSTYEAAESIPEGWRQVAASMQMSKPTFFYKIVFKGALPQIFVGLRSAVSMGWMSVIAAEMISGQSGLGYSIQMNRLNLQYNHMVVDMFAIGLIGFLLFEFITMLEKRVIPWHKKVLKE